MKSALANVGEAELSAEAAKLEQAGREKNISFVLSEIPSFLKTLHTLIEKLEAEKDAEKTEGNKTAAAGDNQFLKEKLQSLKEGCVSLDKKAAKKALAEIREKTWPPAINEQIEAISVHLLHSKFDEIIHIIDNSLQNHTD